jgi:hypothetical protein
MKHIWFLQWCRGQGKIYSHRALASF